MGRREQLVDELAMGITFYDWDETERRELQAAAAAFADEPTPRPLWKEAFRTDPHIPRDDLFMEFFGGRVRVTATIAPTAPEREEVERRKGIAEDMNQVYEDLRREGRTFEEMAEANLNQMLNWKLGPLFDGQGFLKLFERRVYDLAQTPTAEGLARVEALRWRLAMTKNLVETYPAIRDRAADFHASDGLRSMPTLALPALLRAALAAAPNRRAQPSDEFDVEHLVRGLSRCDIVTTDRSMAHLLRTRGLMPESCTLVTGAEGPDGIRAAVQSHLEGLDPK